MVNTPNSVPSTTQADSQARSWLIFAAVGTFAAIIFGVLYLFVIAPAVPDGNLGWFLFSFATGLTMIVLPCTLPLAFVIVPLSMGKGMLRGLSMALAFGLGVAATLSLYGVAAALLGGVAVDALGGDLESIKNWVYFIAGGFALVFALSEIGLMNIHMPTYSGAAPAFIQKRGELLKAFLLGLFLGNVGVGCPHPATPLILIEIASSGDVLYGWLLFLVQALGRLLPLFLLAFLAILGVNGLNWLLARKDAVERATGWAMVFVAGFILTLGLFSHDWWVNSGIHTGLEAITQEQRFNVLINDTLDTEVAHAHGLEEGEGLFGLPLEWGNWFLVLVWLIPIWWWYRKRKKEVDDGSSECDEKLLAVKRNFLIVISVFLISTFVYFLPQNFYLKSTSGEDEGHASTPGHDESGGHTEEAEGMDGMDGMMNMKAEGTPYLSEVSSLPKATEPELVDLNDGDLYDITAGYIQKEVGNRTLRMMAYNGSVPGPFIKASQGAEVTINFTNETDLDQTIHSHGLRLDNDSDGVPGVTQEAVAPGESFTYTLRFDDGGVYWYHPHTRDDYGQELGLYGNYLVEPSDGYNAPVNREAPLVIDDILIVDNKIATFYKEYTNYALLGRFGNEFLVNGEKDYTLDVQTGEVIRFFITNVSNARTYNLSIPGAELKLVAADVGKYEQEFYADDFLISPAERMIAEVYFEEPGTYELTHTTPDNEVILTTFNVSGESVEDSYATEFTDLNSNEEVIAEFANFRDYLEVEADKDLLMTVKIDGPVDHGTHGTHSTSEDGSASDEGADHEIQDGEMMQGMMMEKQDGLDGIQWDDETMSDQMNTSENIEWQLVDQMTGKVSMDIDDWVFKQGDLVKMTITNDPEADHVMQHPFHIHGQRFVVLSEDGVPNENMAWKDTTLVLPGESIEILVEMSNTGEWMAHCHISEHLHAGMMMQFRVEDENGRANGDDYRAAKATAKTIDTTAYSFSGEFNNEDYSVVGVGASPKAEQAVEVQFTLKDRNGNAVDLAETSDRPLRVTFIYEDGSVSLTTYPDNQEYTDDNMMEGMDEMHGEEGHNNDDGHHSWLFINVAYAEPGHDGVSESEATSLYSVPIIFPQAGGYKAVVEFIPEGSDSYEVVAYNLEVRKNSFTVDNFGWSETVEWWVLFIGSIISIIPLVWLVRRYINVKKI